MGKLKALLFIFLLLAIVALYYGFSPVTLPKQPFDFTLNKGHSLNAISRQFEREGLLDNGRLFSLFARILGRSNKIQAGVYRLDHAVSKMELLQLITQGNAGKSQVKIIEGWNFKQLRAELDASQNIKHDTLNMTDSEIAQQIGAPEENPEGMFAPDTYFVAAGSSDIEFLKLAYQTMQRRLQQAWLERDQGVPLTSPYQALILASIVEKETGTAADRGMIAGVFANRLRKHMLLQTDPSVIYGMGEKYTGILHHEDMTRDTPYNTYTRPGLPPTPIAMPGRDAVYAALHPASTDALYFVAKGDGSSQFSKNLADHNRAVDKYQK